MVGYAFNTDYSLKLVNASVDLLEFITQSLGLIAKVVRDRATV